MDDHEVGRELAVDGDCWLGDGVGIGGESGGGWSGDRGSSTGKDGMLL